LNRTAQVFLWVLCVLLWQFRSSEIASGFSDLAVAARSISVNQRFNAFASSWLVIFLPPYFCQKLLPPVASGYPSLGFRISGCAALCLRAFSLPSSSTSFGSVPL